MCIFYIVYIYLFHIALILASPWLPWSKCGINSPCFMNAIEVGHIYVGRVYATAKKERDRERGGRELTFVIRVRCRRCNCWGCWWAKHKPDSSKRMKVSRGRGCREQARVAELHAELSGWLGTGIIYICQTCSMLAAATSNNNKWTPHCLSVTCKNAMHTHTQLHNCYTYMVEVYLYEWLASDTERGVAGAGVGAEAALAHLSSCCRCLALFIY